MAIVLKSPRHLNTIFEFEITNNNLIQIRSIRNVGGNLVPQAPFHYQLDAIRDLYLWLITQTDNSGWVLLGTTNEGGIPPAGSVEEWARAINNPVGGYYGVTQGRQGRFATFIPPIMEYMGLAEVTHNPNNNLMRARRGATITTRHTPSYIQLCNGNYEQRRIDLA